MTRSPLVGEIWSRGGVPRLVLEVGRVVRYQVELAAFRFKGITYPARVEAHACALATWLRWASGAVCTRPAQASLFPRVRS